MALSVRAFALMTAALCGPAALSACSASKEPTARQVLEGYRSVAEASYQAALQGVIQLEAATQALTEHPSASHLEEARLAWKQARVAYSQTEALRFGNWFVDEWEVRVNAWPIDEGFLDYVSTDYLASPTNPNAQANLIAAEQMRIGERSLSSHGLDEGLLEALHTLSDHESNVATGFHAIEFFLWGQDLHRHGGGSGQRPWTDFALTAEQCTDGPQAAPARHCERRRAALQALLSLLRRELEQMAVVWGPQAGSYGDRLVQGPPAEGLRRMLFGLSSLSADELAGERLQVPLLSQAPEEEQDCFSDDTHNSVYFNALGIENLYYGRMGSLQAAVRLADLARVTDATLAADIEQALERTHAAVGAIRQSGEQGQVFDMLIRPGNSQGAVLIQAAIDALQTQAQLFEALGQALGLGSLNPAAPREG